MNEKLRQLSKGTRGKLVIEVLEDEMRRVADIRTPMNVKNEIQNDVRLGVIQVLEELKDRLRISSGELSPPDPNEHV